MTEAVFLALIGLVGLIVTLITAITLIKIVVNAKPTRFNFSTQYGHIEMGFEPNADEI